VQIPERVILIGNGVFKNIQLNEVTIPGNVDYIDDEAFDGNSLSKSVINGKNVLFGSSVFSNNPSNLEYHGYVGSTVERYADLNEH